MITGMNVVRNMPGYSGIPGNFVPDHMLPEHPGHVHAGLVNHCMNIQLIK